MGSGPANQGAACICTSQEEPAVPAAATAGECAAQQCLLLSLCVSMLLPADTLSVRLQGMPSRPAWRAAGSLIAAGPRPAADGTARGSAGAGLCRMPLSSTPAPPAPGTSAGSRRGPGTCRCRPAPAPRAAGQTRARRKVGCNAERDGREGQHSKLQCQRSPGCPGPPTSYTAPASPMASAMLPVAGASSRSV